jgi:hypothetical protein
MLQPVEHRNANMRNDNKNIGRWTLKFLLTLILSFIIFILMPLLFGLPWTYLPLLIFIAGFVAVAFSRKFLKKD